MERERSDPPSPSTLDFRPATPPQVASIGNRKSEILPRFLSAAQPLQLPPIGNRKSAIGDSSAPCIGGVSRPGSAPPAPCIGGFAASLPPDNLSPSRPTSTSPHTCPVTALQSASGAIGGRAAASCMAAQRPWILYRRRRRPASASAASPNRQSLPLPPFRPSTCDLRRAVFGASRHLRPATFDARPRALPNRQFPLPLLLTSGDTGVTMPP